MWYACNTFDIYTHTYISSGCQYATNCQSYAFSIFELMKKRKRKKADFVAIQCKQFCDQKCRKITKYYTYKHVCMHVYGWLTASTESLTPNGKWHVANILWPCNHTCIRTRIRTSTHNLFFFVVVFLFLLFDERYNL